jgi:hypothetical protein
MRVVINTTLVYLYKRKVNFLYSLYIDNVLCIVYNLSIVRNEGEIRNDEFNERSTQINKGN